MAMPLDMSDSGGERTDDPGSYRRTCAEFVGSMVPDYEAWVEYYKLPADEDRRRRAGISSAASKCARWLETAGTIRAIDVVMNDGIQKMAEATAGRPFQLGVFVNSAPGYATAPAGTVPVRVRAHGRDGRLTRLGFHYGSARFRVDSTFEARMPDDPGSAEHESMDMQIPLDASSASPGDLVSFTVTVVEVGGGVETDRRGVTTLVRIA